MTNSPEIILGQLLSDLSMTLAVAESCTGGLVGHKLTSVPGSSNYFCGGVISYSNFLKQKLIGVKESTLANFGAVSEEVALEMAEGVRLATGADIGISISGIAGPGGGTAEKPVGLVWTGYSSAIQANAIPYQFSGTRAEIKELSANSVLKSAVGFVNEQAAEIITFRSKKRNLREKFQPVNVTARFSSDGEIEPVRLILDGKEIRISSKRKKSIDPDRLIFLVILPYDQMYKLIYEKSKNSWFLDTTGNRSV